jgi:Golgi nucleoside diphosphatase
MENEIELLIFKTRLNNNYAFLSKAQAVDVLEDDEHDSFDTILSKYGATYAFKKFKKEDIINYIDEINLIDNICFAYGYLNLTWK